MSTIAMVSITTSYNTSLAQPSGVSEELLKQLILNIEALRSDRNKIAHTQTVDAALARGIREVVLGQHGQPGLLYRLCSSLNPPPDVP